MVPVDLEQLPVATVLVRDGVFFALNKAYEELMGWPGAALIGKPLVDMLGGLLSERDFEIVAHRIRTRSPDAPRSDGRLWCRIRTASGSEVPVRVEWRHDPNGRDMLVTLVDAQPEAFGLEVTEALARAAGAFSGSLDEQGVLQQAVDTLCARGFTATMLLLIDDDPLLQYGPSRSPTPSPGGVQALPRPPKQILTLLNPMFMERRAAFFQDGVRIVREAFPEPIAAELLRLLPATRMVQAPLFVGSVPYGALVVTSDALSPLVATALELFGELVGKAVETVRLRKELVARERLAALGEAAGVMAHEVRNPVGSIMNALVLIKRENVASPTTEALLTVIGEESARLENLVSQLLQLGRPMDPRPRPFALEELARRAVRLLSTRGELRERKLDLPTSEETLAFHDPDLMELALTNILRNAEQSTNRGARIRISIEATPESAQCIVEDDGPGFPDDLLERIGQPFVTTRATGTGMGLALVRRIMEASRGKLHVGRGELGGARVVLELPRPRVVV